MNWLKQVFKENRSNWEEFEFDHKSGGRIQIYHERQVKELCALHALNNLFQEEFFSKSILDSLCIE